MEVKIIGWDNFIDQPTEDVVHVDEPLTSEKKAKLKEQMSSKHCHLCWTFKSMEEKAESANG